MFRPLAAELAPGFEVVGVEYPGHGARFGEAPSTDLVVLAAEIASLLATTPVARFAFYGHSNGALLAFEVARQLHEAGREVPEVLVLGAKRSPTLAPRRPVHRLPDDTFLEVIRGYGGTPAEVFASPELIRLCLPILRADFALGETYRLGACVRLPIDAALLAGTADHLAPEGEVAAWAPLFSCPPSLERVDGGHFFAITHASATAAAIRRACLTLAL